MPSRLSIDPVLIGGIGLWAIALYLSFYPVSQRLVEQLSHWLNFAKAGSAQDAQSTFWASIASVLPFLAIGGLCYYGIVISLGQSWAISVGLIACVAGGIYELGRRDGESPE